MTDAPPPPPPFIVAEISKNWRDGREAAPGTGLLAQQFERVINVNHSRGYRLHTFQIHRAYSPDDREMNETIIAVFELRDVRSRLGH